MKTDTETLRKRGFLTNTEAEPYFLYSKEELLELLKDKTAVNRTAALFILRSFVDINELDEAFNQSEAFLKQLDFQNPVVQAEIERSLSLINKRKSKVVY